MLQTQISSNPDDLDELFKSHPWLPNSKTCRPNEITQIEKIELINTSSLDDIVSLIFEDKKGWVFKPTRFRYNLPSETSHWVLWNSYYTMEWNADPNEITEVIFTLLYEHLGNDKFDFAWYINPKPTVKQFYHVQVFWIILI
jgi:hypothetical protein